MIHKQYNPEYAKTKQQLYYIFTYYCSFADRDNFQILKILNYKRMLTDAQIIKNQNNNSELDVLFMQNRKNCSGICFDSFVNMLPEIAKIVYQNVSLEQRLRKMIHSNFHSLFEFIKDNTDFGQTIKFLSKAYFSQSCFILLKSLSVTLYQIYTTYFDLKTIQICHQRQQIFKKLTTLAKNFQLMPHPMSKTQHYLIFNQIIDQQATSIYKQWFDEDKNSKQIFKYFQFLQYLLVASLVANKKIGGTGLTQLKQLVNLLQIMELSEGFSKMCKNVQINCHLIPNPKLIKQLQYGNHTIEVTPSLQSLISPVKKKSPKQPQNKFHHKFLQNYSELHKKFISFCLHGQTISNSYLTHKKAIDILKLMQLGLQQSQIQLYLASVNKTLEFESFITILQKISQKKLIPDDDLIDKFLNIELYEEIQHGKRNLQRISSINNDQQYNNCLAIIEQASHFLKTAFLVECQPANEGKVELSFIFLNAYLKIMHDFEVCPLYLSKQSLIQIFRKSIKKSQDFMNFQQFKNSFITALPYLDLSMKDSTKELSAQTKLIITFQRIKSSRGASKIYSKHSSKNKEDFSISLRQKFKAFYPEDSFYEKQGGQTRNLKKIKTSLY